MHKLRRVVLLAPFLLAACYGDYVPDYRELYPIRVQMQPAALPVAFAPGRTELGGAESARLDAFLADYRSGNRSPLILTANPTGVGDDVARTRARSIERRALAVGVSPAALQTRLLAGAARSDEVIVSYERAVAVVPECGDWSKNTAMDATNTTGSNFGCSTQRYLGLQAADPADLVHPRAAAGRDGQRTVDVMQKYRTGKQTGAQAPAQSTQSFSTGSQ
jgi:pilus assembly protein CpaD